MSMELQERAKHRKRLKNWFIPTTCCGWILDIPLTNATIGRGGTYFFISSPRRNARKVVVSDGEYCGPSRENVTISTIHSQRRDATAKVCQSDSGVQKLHTEGH